jgi:hypothetical protein
MPTQGEPDALFFELETRLHRPAVRRSKEALSELLAGDCIEFGRSGNVHDKASQLEDLPREEGYYEIAVENFAVRGLAAGLVPVTYLSSRSDAHGTRAVRRSSIWKLNSTAGRLVT